MTGTLVLNNSSFVELTNADMMLVDGGFTAEQWIRGTCVVVGAVVGTVAGAGVCSVIGVKAGSVAGIAICSAMGIASGYGANKVGEKIIN